MRRQIPNLTAADVSLDKTLIIYGSKTGMLYLLQIRETLPGHPRLRAERKLRGHATKIVGLMFCRGKSFVVSCDAKGIIIVWVTDSGRELCRVSMPSESLVESLAYLKARNGSAEFIAGRNKDGLCVLWTLADNKLIEKDTVVDVPSDESLSSVFASRHSDLQAICQRPSTIGGRALLNEDDYLNPRFTASLSSHQGNVVEVKNEQCEDACKCILTACVDGCIDEARLKISNLPSKHGPRPVLAVVGTSDDFNNKPFVI